MTWQRIPPPEPAQDSCHCLGGARGVCSPRVLELALGVCGPARRILCLAGALRLGFGELVLENFGPVDWQLKECRDSSRCVIYLPMNWVPETGKGAKFAKKVAVAQSTAIGIVFFAVILIFHDKYGMIFTTSSAVLEEVDKLAFLLALPILLNSVQPVLSRHFFG
ncbi:hypothetical protein V2J09_013853 [Rumex salicifolius]